MRCEDFPCCGHELGCCPDFDASGKQLNMVCTCGAKIPLNSRYSICESCMEDDCEEFFDDEHQEMEDFERADEYYGEREDYGDWGYEGCHEM